MQSFTDHYAEWDIQQDAPLEKIQKKLRELYNDWVAKKVHFPKEALPKLVLLEEATTIFENEASRKQYDRDLAESKKKPISVDPNAERFASFQKWYADAKEYYGSRQYDLAKTAIEKALSFFNQDSDNPELFRTASMIYKDNHDFSFAMSYINKAIVAAPETASYDLDKFTILESEELRLQKQSYNEREKIAQIISDEKNVLETAARKANQYNNQHDLATAYDYLAFVWYYKTGASPSTAEDYAKKALAIDNSQPNAIKVINDINGKRKNAEEEKQRQKVVDEKAAQRKAHNDPIYKEIENLNNKIKAVRVSNSEPSFYFGMMEFALLVAGILIAAPFVLLMGMVSRYMASAMLFFVPAGVCVFVAVIMVIMGIRASVLENQRAALKSQVSKLEQKLQK